MLTKNIRRIFILQRTFFYRSLQSQQYQLISRNNNLVERMKAIESDNARNMFRDQEISNSQEDVYEVQVFQESEEDPRQQLEKLKGYLKEQPVFSPTNLRLVHLLRISNKKQLKQNKSMLNCYFDGFKLAKETNSQFQQYSSDALFSQFIANHVNNIQSCNMIYCTIRQVELNRYNVLIRARSGELIAFYETILYCKIVVKIIKLLQKIRKPSCFILQDFSGDYRFTLELGKIREEVTELFYRYQKILSNDFKIDDYIFEVKQAYQKTQQLFFTIDQGHLTAFSKIFVNQLCFQIGQHQVQRMNQFQSFDNKLLCSLRKDLPETKRNLSFDFLAINVARIYHCQYTAVPEIISKLIMDQERKFELKEQQQKIKQKEWKYLKNKDAHYPQRMNESKQCKRCEFLPKKLRKKSTYRCEGCSAQFKKDIPLCPQCYGDFHERIDFFQPKIAKPNKRIIKRIQKKTHPEQNIISNKDSNIFDQFSSSLQNKSSQIESINPFTVQKIIQLNNKMTENIQMTEKLINGNNLEVSKLFLFTNLAQSLQNIKKNLHRFPLVGTETSQVALSLKNCPKNEVEQIGTDAFKQKMDNLFYLNFNQIFDTTRKKKIEIIQDSSIQIQQSEQMQSSQADSGDDSDQEGSQQQSMQQEEDQDEDQDQDQDQGQDQEQQQQQEQEQLQDQEQQQQYQQQQEELSSSNS